MLGDCTMRPSSVGATPGPRTTSLLASLTTSGSPLRPALQAPRCSMVAEPPLIRTFPSFSMRTKDQPSTKHSWLRMSLGTPNWVMVKRLQSHLRTLIQPAPRKQLLSGWIGSSTTAADSVEKFKWTFSLGSFCYRGLASLTCILFRAKPVLTLQDV